MERFLRYKQIYDTKLPFPSRGNAEKNQAI